MEKDKSKLLNILKILAGITIFFAIILFIIAYQIGVEGLKDKANRSTIISGLLSMVGGAMGAIGAYTAANLQIRKEREIENFSKLTSELPIQIGVSLELEKIIAQLDEYINIQTEFLDIFGDGKINENLYYHSLPPDALIWKRWDNINKISDPILLVELLKFNESTKRMLEVIAFNLDDLQSEIQTLKSSSEALNIIKASEKLNLINTIKKDKIHYWSELVFCRQKAKLIQGKIKERETKIKSIIKNKQFNELGFSREDEFKVDREKNN
ncbi:hypothetical protein [Lysinibacillus sp. G01H]|uniref:hypothetical protein n=1 Tax=Lysinibacillus sp. G01H TaxID=3026425 RepID=UPI00237DDDB3|nr:hypothetical protein [Lysinibacillus sp. G01H]WDU80020.1 hypothetical protein PSR12_02430 [Lysinibacillus sp. G01H]